MGKEEAPDEKHRPSTDFCIHLRDTTFHVNKRSMASKSAMLAQLLNPRHPPHRPAATSDTLDNIPTDPKTFETAALFCHGHGLDLSADNVLPVACLAHFLEMTEAHCQGNLLSKAVAFLSDDVLPHWNDTIRAFRAMDAAVLPRAKRFGLVDACVDSIATKVIADPNLLKDPSEKNNSSSKVVAPAAGVKRRLFLLECAAPAEDVTSLPLEHYVLVMKAIIHSGVAEEDIALCLHRYAKAKVGTAEGGSTSPMSTSQRREVVEAVERLLPDTKGALHANRLLEILRWAISFQTSDGCCSGLEARIARQLPEVDSADNLLLPPSGYATETAHDVESARRILSAFCTNYYKAGDSDPAELMAVADLMGDLLVIIAKDPNLKKESFTAILGMIAAILSATGRRTDGVYRAIDAYLVAQGHATEFEREELCRLLDVPMLSPEACEHAARNERLPVRVVAKVLFVGQLRIREVVAGVLRGVAGEEEEEEEEKGVVEEEEEVRREVESMEGRVGRLERECGEMREEIERRGRGRRGRKKGGLWKEMVGLKLGCKGGGGGAMEECNCYVKKVHPRKTGI